ncbi:MAG: sigma-70 family RNA polymerase sigma factor [Gemmataceae bacterium]
MPPTDPPDPAGATSRTLLQRAVARDPDAWQRLVHLYRPLVISWCLRAGVRFDDADDVAQEVFRAAVGRLPDFRRDRPGDTFRGWLRAIARNQAIVHHRRGRGPAAAGGSTAHLVLSAVPDPVPPDEDDDPQAEVSALYRRALELVRGEFEGRTWDMFWQVVVDNRPTDEVATAFGVTAAAVRQAKARVLRRLKEEVGDAL